MNVASITQLVHDLTNTNNGTFSDADILRHLNIRYGHRILDILRVSVDKNASLTEATTDFLSITGLNEGDNGYNGEFSFPSNLLRPVRCEVSFDGATWVNAEVYDINENKESEHDADGLKSFSKSSPHVRFERDSFFVRPLNDGGTVVKGIHIWYESRQADLASGSPIFEANLHDILAYDVAEIEYIKHSSKYDNNQFGRFKSDKAEKETRFTNFYKNRFKRNLRMKVSHGNYK